MAGSSRLPPFLLGIAGGSGAGKSTLARALQEVTAGKGRVILEHDAYYRDLSRLPWAARAKADFDSVEALDNALLCRHLRQLKRGETVATPRYDFATHTRLPARLSVPPTELIIVVGILILAVPEVCSLLDAKVFVAAPPCVRFIRRLVRDVRERGRTVRSVVQQYRRSVRPAFERLVAPSAQHADLIVSGLDLPAAVKAVRKLVRERRPSDVTCGND